MIDGQRYMWIEIDRLNALDGKDRDGHREREREGEKKKKKGNIRKK